MSAKCLMVGERVAPFCQSMPGVRMGVGSSSGTTRRSADCETAVSAMMPASRAYVMEEGRIVAHGQAGELLTRPEIQKAYLGLKPDD